MVKGELITLYSYVWEPILRDNMGGHDLIEFARKLPELRKALSCSVCTQLLTNRMVLCPTKCRKHFVCDGCKGKKRDDNNKCGDCEDWDTFKEDETLYLLLRNYQDFCYYVLTTEDIVRLLEVKHEVDPTFDTFKLIELVSEGVKGSALLKKRKLLPIPNAERDRGVTPHNVSSLKRNKKARVGDIKDEAGTTPVPSVPKQTVSAPAAIDNNSSKKPEGLLQVPQNKPLVLDKREKCVPQIQTPVTAEKKLPVAASKPVAVSTIPTTRLVSNLVVTTPVSSFGSKPQLPVSLVGKMGTVQPSAAPPPPVKVGINKVLSSPMMHKTVSIRNVAPLQTHALDKPAVVSSKVTPVTGTPPSAKVTTTMVSSSNVNKNVPSKITTQSYISVQGPTKIAQQPTLPTERVIAVSKVQVQPLSSSTQSTAPINVFPPPPKVVIADKPTVVAVSTAAKVRPQVQQQQQQPPVISTSSGIRTPATSPSGEKLSSVRVVPLPISTVEKVSSNRPQVQSTPMNKSIPSKPPVPPSPTRPVVVESPKQQLPKVTCVTTVGTGVPISGSKYIQIKVEPQPQMYLSKASTPEVPTTSSSITNLLTNDMISKSLMSDGTGNQQHQVQQQQQIEQILPHSPIKSSPLPPSSKPPLVPVATATPINVNPLPFTLSQNSLTSSGQPQFIQISHQGGVRTLSIRPQQMRFTGAVQFQGRTVPVHIIGPPPTSDALKQQIAQQLARRKLIPSSESTDVQHIWSDQPKIIHLNASEFCRLQGFGQATTIRSNNPVNVGPVSTASSTTTASFTSVNVRPVANTGSLVRPTTTTTSVSNVTSLANALNTMKTTTVYSQPNSSVQISRATPTTATSLGTIRQVQPPTPSSTTTSSCSSSAAATSTTTTATSKRKQEGCRCGNATPNPGSGKLTCIGQRCACYADGNACSDCKCKGCKNPYLPGAGGKKVLHSQTSQAIPFVSSMAGGLTSATMLPNVTSTASNVSLGSNVNFGPMQAGPSTGVTHPTVQLIPLRFGQPGLGQYIQIANAHGLQQLPVQQIFFNGASLPSSATGITIQGVPVSSLSGIHQMAQIQQQQQQRPPLQMGMHLKADRNPNDGI